MSIRPSSPRTHGAHGEGISFRTRSELGATPLEILRDLRVSVVHFSYATEVQMQTPNTFRGGPDARGHFGVYGGRFFAETLMPPILAVEAAYNAAKDDPSLQAELDHYFHPL